MKLYCAEALECLRSMPADSVDMVFSSPPYESARTYGIGFKLRGQDWVDFLVPIWLECNRVCRGLVAMVVEGQTRGFRWSATPALLMTGLHRRGLKLRKPPAFCRVGIPGSGGPDWLRNDYEFVVCTSRGRLPWSDSTAMGHPPKWAPGGEMSYRNSDGKRRNVRGGGEKSGRTRKANGEKKVNGSLVSGGLMTNRDAFGFTPHVEPSETQRRNGKRRVTITRERGGMHSQGQPYVPPVKANPGNLIRCKVGGGQMGHPLCHENEAPFPESLVEFFVRSFCRPGGVVLDPFIGSGTTAVVALRNGREAVGIDVRQSQIELTRLRVQEQLGAEYAVESQEA